MGEPKKRAGGFLFNKKHPFPKGHLFMDPDEYEQALAGDEGWNTGPADAAKAKKVKAEAEAEVEEEVPPGAPVGNPGPPVENIVAKKPKSKSRRRKK